MFAKPTRSTSRLLSKAEPHLVNLVADFIVLDSPSGVWLVANRLMLGTTPGHQRLEQRSTAFQLFINHIFAMCCAGSCEMPWVLYDVDHSPDFLADQADKWVVKFH